MFLADLHLHTQFSDGSLSPFEVVDLMGKNGIKAIAITDHLCEEKTLLGKGARFLGKTLLRSNFDTYMQTLNKASQYAKEKYDMLLIPGLEITKNSFSHKKSAHILALNIKEYINPDLSIPDTVNEIHKQGGGWRSQHTLYTQERSKLKLIVYGTNEMTLKLSLTRGKLLVERYYLPRF